MALLEPRPDNENTPDIVDHWTVERVGGKPFHLQLIDMGNETAQLHAIIAIDNAPQRIIIDYPYPKDFEAVLWAMSEEVPIHMVGFEGNYLADARTVWGYVCPCGLGEG